MLSSKELPNPDDLVLKIILIGDSGVGKSCLLKSFMGDPFKGTYTSTIGVDFEIKPVQVEGKTVNLQIWDTAGQERFRTITTSYYRSADAIVLVFDLTSALSFTNLDTWMTDVRAYGQRGVEVMVVGNKIDLAESERAVEFKDAKEWADKNGFQYMETSAKKRVNVDKAFMKLTNAVYNAKVSNALNRSTPLSSSTNNAKVTLSSTNTEEEKSSCSC